MRKMVLWGHHVEEYEAMFSVSRQDLASRILEYGCGPSAVNATLHDQSQLVISTDPLFQLPEAELKKSAIDFFESRATQVLADQNQFNVNHYGGMEAFIASRRKGMADFFADYAKGCLEKRYLPDDENGLLPFTPYMFDFAFCSHYLFAEPNLAVCDHHIQVISELARVAHEVRIFPLIDRVGQPSILLGPILLGLQQRHFGVEVREVSHSLYPQGNAMLRVWAQRCAV